MWSMYRNVWREKENNVKHFELFPSLGIELSVSSNVKMCQAAKRSVSLNADQ